MDGIDHMRQGVSAKAAMRDPLSYGANVNGYAECLMTARHGTHARAKCQYLIPQMEKNEMSGKCGKDAMNNKNCVNMDQWGEKMDPSKYLATNFPPHLDA